MNNNNSKNITLSKMKTSNGFKTNNYDVVEGPNLSLATIIPIIALNNSAHFLNRDISLENSYISHISKNCAYSNDRTINILNEAFNKYDNNPQSVNEKVKKAKKLDNIPISNNSIKGN